MLKESRSEKPFRVIDEQERLEWIRRASPTADQDSTDGVLRLTDVADRIATAKQQLLSVGVFEKTGNSEMAAVAKVYRKYQHLLNIQNLFDFEDLIFNAVLLLESAGDKPGSVRMRFSHVLVDEYQDSGDRMYAILTDF